MEDAVTAVIPGAKRPSQVEENIRAAALEPLTDSALRQIEALYHERIRPLVHQRW